MLTLISSDGRYIALRSNFAYGAIARVGNLNLTGRIRGKATWSRKSSRDTGAITANRISFHSGTMFTDSRGSGALNRLNKF